MMSEDLVEYETPKIQLGHYVSQLSRCCEDNTLGAFLKTCGTKITEDEQLSEFEMGTVKSCISQANNGSEQVSVIDPETHYESFINQFSILYTPWQSFCLRMAYG